MFNSEYIQDLLDALKSLDVDLEELTEQFQGNVKELNMIRADIVRKIEIANWNREYMEGGVLCE